MARWLKVLPFLAVLFWQPSPARYTLLIPAFHYDYAGARSGYCVAWQDDNRPFLANRLAASCWYNASSYRHVDNGRALPIIRPNFPATEAAVIAELGADYDGYLLALNEPEWPGQDDLTPRQAVTWINEIHRALPHARLVGPNITPDGFGWLAEYLAIGGRPFEVWGIHIYYGGKCAPVACVDGLCAIVGNAYDGDCRVWVTEIGIPRYVPDAPAIFGEWLGELDGRVERVFVYTAVNGCCDGQLDLIVDGEVTEIGRAWLNN